jgi:hypothetical protein
MLADRDRPSPAFCAGSGLAGAALVVGLALSVSLPRSFAQRPADLGASRSSSPAAGGASPRGAIVRV